MEKYQRLSLYHKGYTASFLLERFSLENKSPHMRTKSGQTLETKTKGLRQYEINHFIILSLPLILNDNLAEPILKKNKVSVSFHNVMRGNFASRANTLVSFITEKISNA